MRVISQNGLIDVPYEMTAFHIARQDIRMNMVGDTGKGTVMAQYSSQEKALGAMKSLRKFHEKIKLMEIRHDAGDFIGNTFQFPEDDEVET